MRRLTTVLIFATYLASRSFGQVPPAAPKAAATWQDDAEAEMGVAVQNEKDPSLQLNLLQKWEQQYPNSAYKDQRTLRIANALLTLVGAALTNPVPASLDSGEKAARQLIAGFS